MDDQNRIAILHLSDCHFSTDANFIEKHVDAIVCAVQNEIIGHARVILLVSGDIAFCGSIDEYAVAEKILGHLRDRLKSRIGDAQLVTAVVPGNHDCNFNQDTAARRSLLGLKSIELETSWDHSIPSACASVQDGYRAFEACFGNDLQSADPLGLVSSVSLSSGAQAVTLWGINSALMSQKKERPGELWFPLQQLSAAVQGSSAAFNVLVLHHPFSWFRPEIKRDFYALADSSFAVVMAGHEHLVEGWSRSDLDGRSSLYVEGGVLQNHHAADSESSFNLVSMNLSAHQVNVVPYILDGSVYARGKEKSWNFGSVTNGVRSSRALQDRCLSYLESPGATFRHPRKQDLSLDDVFVYPDLVDLEEQPTPEQLEKVVSSDAVIQQINVDRGIAVIGAEKSGKTTLLRKYYLDLHRAGYTPVRVDGHSIKSGDYGKVSRLIEGEYLQQYRANSSDPWRQLDKEKRALIIDDFSSARLNAEARKLLLEDLRRLYGIVILSCDDGVLYRPVSDTDPLAEFHRYEIMEFGHRLRDRLISKWISLGQETDLEQAQLQMIRDQRAKAINALIGKNFIPSRPIFLLTLLQGIESGAAGSIKGASFGEYYEFLIREALVGAAIQPGEFDAVLNYLSELAYNLVSRDAHELPVGELQSFEVNFARRYAITLNFDRLRRQLLAADIFDLWDENYRFKYRYVRYFFAAKYLAKRYRKDQEITAQVAALARHLYISRCADLLMFVTHHCDDPNVVDDVLREAAARFSSTPPLKLTDDVGFINELVTELPQMALASINSEEYRQKRLKERDEVEGRSRQAPREEDGEFALSTLANAPSPELDLAAELNLSVRILAVLGQILRNHYGSLLAERKAQIAKEGYDLIGRLLSNFLKVFSSARDDLLDELSKILVDNDVSTKDVARKHASRFVFGMLSWVIFSLVKRGSELLGSERLQITHQHVGESDNSMLNKLLALAIDLDHPSIQPGQVYRLPTERLEDLFEELPGNPCAQLVLKRLAVDHLYMFSVSFKDKQRLCEVLGISVRKQQQISIGSLRSKS